MDSSPMVGAGVGIFFVVLFCIMTWTTYTIVSTTDTAEDMDGYSLSVPLGIAGSGFGMGLLAGLYSYAQINTTYVFTVSITVSFLALGILYGAFCLTAITH